MHNVKAMAALIAIITLSLSDDAAALESGPVLDPLTVRLTYLTTGSTLYVEFRNNAMPGCYASGGGYLLKTHENFNELYSQILMLIATGGIRGQVMFNVVNPGASNWGDCHIIGLALEPAPS